MRARLISVAGFTAVASLYTWLRQDAPAVGVVEPSARAAHLSTDARTPPTPVSSRWLIDRDALADAAADPFVPKQPPAPPPQIIPLPPPPRPVAPPFPYKYFGRVTSPDGTQAIYLTQGDRLIPVEAKATLEGGYRVDSIVDSQIVVVYAPLNEKTVISMPSGQGTQ